MGKRVQIGEVINITAAADLIGGEVVAFGTRGGVVARDTAIGEIAALQIEGVFEFPATLVDTIALGDLLYWDDATKQLTVSATNNTLLGKATTEKAGSVEGVVCVKLEG